MAMSVPMPLRAEGCGSMVVDTCRSSDCEFFILLWKGIVPGYPLTHPLVLFCLVEDGTSDLINIRSSSLRGKLRLSVEKKTWKLGKKNLFRINTD